MSSIDRRIERLEEYYNHLNERLSRIEGKLNIITLIISVSFTVMVAVLLKVL